MFSVNSTPQISVPDTRIGIISTLWRSRYGGPQICGGIRGLGASFRVEILGFAVLVPFDAGTLDERVLQ